MGTQIPSFHSLLLLLFLWTSPIVLAASEAYQTNPSKALSGEGDTAESRHLTAGLRLGLGPTASPLSQAFNIGSINPALLGPGPATAILTNPLLTRQIAANRIGLGLENSPSLGAGLAGLAAGNPSVGGLGGLGTNGLNVAGLSALGLGAPGIGAHSLGIDPSTTQGVGLNPALANALGGRSILSNLPTGQSPSAPVSDLLKLGTYLNSEDWKEILGAPGSPPNVAVNRNGDEEINTLIQTLNTLRNASPIAGGAGLPLGSNLQGSPLANPLLQRMLVANALQLANARALQMMALARSEPYLGAQKRSLELSSPDNSQQRHPSPSQEYTSQEYYSSPYNRQSQYDKNYRASSGFIEISGKPSNRNYSPRHRYTDRYNRRDRSFVFPRDL